MSDTIIADNSENASNISADFTLHVKSAEILYDKLKSNDTPPFLSEQYVFVCEEVNLDLTKYAKILSFVKDSAFCGTQKQRILL